MTTTPGRPLRRHVRPRHQPRPPGTLTRQIACEWLKSNVAIWTQWIPYETKCRVGWGLVGPLGNYVANRSVASSCQWCEPGRYSVELRDFDGMTWVCPVAALDAQQGARHLRWNLGVCSSRQGERRECHRIMYEPPSTKRVAGAVLRWVKHSPESQHDALKEKRNTQQRCDTGSQAMDVDEHRCCRHSATRPRSLCHSHA